MHKGHKLRANTWRFRLLRFQENLAMQISQFTLTGVEADQISLIFGPIKMPYFNLPSLSFGNFSIEYSKPLPRLFIV